MQADRFDADYYNRFYFSKATRIAHPEYFDRIARFVSAYLDMLGCSIYNVLDAGCGAGLLHPGLRLAWPKVNIDAFDVSTYACETYGWENASLETFETDKVYDLVICHDVVQYLDRAAAKAALDKLSSLTSTALFFGVLTQEDWDNNCDQRLTDGDANLRTSAWYRKRLSGTFRNAGGGLYIRKDTDVVMYSLESL